jgi:uncharacterized protein YcbX
MVAASGASSYSVSGGVSGTVAELWRYPVKSMRGERLAASEVGWSGLVGDRVYALVDGESGKVCSAKHPRLWGRLLECEAWYPEAPAAAGPCEVGIRLPDGTETGSRDPDVDARLSAFAGRRVSLTSVAPTTSSYLAVWPEGLMPEEFLARVAVPGAEEDEGALTELPSAAALEGFFDVAALHVVVSSSVARLGELEPDSEFEVTRFRPNVVLDGEVAPFAENEWAGRSIDLGPVVRASVMIPTMRCVMTSLAQGGLPRDNKVLRALSRHNRLALPAMGTWSCLGAYASVVATGTVAVGDIWKA